MRNRQMLEAGLGGVLATCVDVALLAALVELVRIPVPVAAFAASSAGAVVSFVSNRRLAFRGAPPVTVLQVVRYGLVATATALLMAALIALVVELHVPYLIAKLVCAVAVFVAWTYPAQRLVFVARPAASASR